MNKLEVLSEIKSFLEGYNDDLKYIVNVETNPSTNIAECVIHEPDREIKIVKVPYQPFMYMKDLSKHNIELFAGKSNEMKENKKKKYGITVTKLKTANHKRLIDGYCYKITSDKSYNAIIDYLKDGGIDIYEKARDSQDKAIKDTNGKYVYIYRDLFYAPKLTEQFFISTRSRLYKGFDEYKQIHRLIFDIETTTLRYHTGRIFLIGIRDNRGFETILEAEKMDDDESEIKLIQDFFNIIDYLKPDVISGYNSEMFDFDFILGRAKILGMDLEKLPAGLKGDFSLKRRPNATLKYGSNTDKYTATEMWGYSVIDIFHAAKRTAAINSDIESTSLKYIAKFEKIAKANRTYIKGEDFLIGKYYRENKIFMINEKNEYIQIPDEYQEVANKLFELQKKKNEIDAEKYKKLRNSYISSAPGLYEWLKKEAIQNGMNSFINGKNIVIQYLLDDLWETEQIDELYNQSSFMLAKIVPTTYQRICTMGTASIWNLLMTAWSYENDLAIPAPDVLENFPGGLARCFKTGYTNRIIKIDYNSLYPSIELTYDIFPIFDITGVLKKILLYLTTTRNIYKNLGNGLVLNDEEKECVKIIDKEVYHKYAENKISANDVSMFKIKQLPVKALNNSLFGALGSNISFNWSDNISAARITCTGRLYLRHAIWWFSKFGCTPLLAVTDGINFQYPEKTNIRIDGKIMEKLNKEESIEKMWQYNGERGIKALIEKYNTEEMKSPYMKIADDGESIACFNLSRINYATLSLVKDKKTGEMKEKIKLTGNTIKSKVLPEYIREFIDNGLNMILHGEGKKFVDYYYDYCENIRYMQIPLKKIASKSRVKVSIKEYLERGVDKNGREKARQAHMELLIKERNEIAENLFNKYKDQLVIIKPENELTIEDKIKLVSKYMPPEPELDSVVYYVNTGTQVSHGDVAKKSDGTIVLRCKLIKNEDLEKNPNMIGEYNYKKYLAAFNARVKSLFVGFDPEIRNSILVKIDKEGNLIKNSFASYQLELKNFDKDSIEESMYLEEKEVDIWNRNGLDARLIWDGFKMYNDKKIYFEIYENALNYLNEKMKAANKPLIKSINSKYEKGDFVLIKEDSSYHVGVYNGIFIDIVKYNVQVPKSEVELELDRKLEEKKNKLENLKISELVIKSNRELYLEELNKRKIKYFEIFKKERNIPDHFTMEELFKEVPNIENAFNDFVSEIEEEREAEAMEQYEPEDNYFVDDIDS